MVSLANRILIWFKSAYCRITLTKTTLTFFLFAFAVCFAQSFVQAFLFQLDSDTCSLTSAIVSAGQVPNGVFAWLSESHNDTTDESTWMLKLCNQIPFEKEQDPCVVVFDSDDAGVNNVPPGFRKRDDEQANSTRLPSSFGEAFISPVFDPSSGNVSAVELDLNDGQLVSLGLQCTRVVLYADQVLTNSKREAWALIGSEFWMFLTSVHALLYGSIAHLYATLIFRVLSVAWSAYSVWRTHDIDRRFDVLITNGACGVELFPDYVRPRIAIQSVEVGLNFLALLITAFLISRLVRTYAKVMYRCIGPPDHVVKTHRYVLALFTCLQIAVYLLITSAGLWLDQLVNGAIASISSHMTLYLSIFIATLVLLVPWILIGWHSVRFEKHLQLYAFIGLGLLFEGSWSGMYQSLVWRWTWIQWPFFASTAVASQIIMLTCIGFAVVCRMNFGKGLKEYLHAASALEKEDFEPEVFDNSEKRTSGPSDDDRWEADLERKIAADRLSQTLDFGAHQPPPPLSPPSWTVLAAPPRSEVAGSGSGNALVGVRATEETSRPDSFSTVLPTLPTLEKFSPWNKHKEKDEGNNAGSHV